LPASCRIRLAKPIAFDFNSESGALPRPFGAVRQAPFKWNGASRELRGQMRARIVYRIGQRGTTPGHCRGLSFDWIWPD